MAGIVEKIMGFLGFEEAEAVSGVQEPSSGQPRLIKDNVVTLPSNRQLRMIIARPYVYDQAAEVGEYLKARQPVLLNLETCDAEVARRLLDFMSGVIYALGGNMEKVSEGIFVFTPHNVEISHSLDGEIL